MHQDHSDQVEQDSTRHKRPEPALASEEHSNTQDRTGEYCSIERPPKPPWWEQMIEHFPAGRHYFGRSSIPHETTAIAA
jgi:hypothetical protein